MEELSLDSQEGYFENLRQLIIYGESNANYYLGTIIRRESQSPWDLYFMGGRQAGKTALLQRIEKFAAAARRGRLTAVEELAERALTPPKPSDMPVTVRWKCPKPTDPPIRVLHDGQYRVFRGGVDPGFGDFLHMWQEKR